MIGIKSKSISFSNFPVSMLSWEAAITLTIFAGQVLVYNIHIFSIIMNKRQ